MCFTLRVLHSVLLVYLYLLTAVLSNLFESTTTTRLCDSSNAHLLYSERWVFFEVDPPVDAMSSSMREFLVVNVRLLYDIALYCLAPLEMAGKYEFVHILDLLNNIISESK